MWPFPADLMLMWPISTRVNKPRTTTIVEPIERQCESQAEAIMLPDYDEDWARLGWVMLRGRAEILSQGTEHQEAQSLLRSRYPQLGAMQSAKYPVIAVRIERTTSWGNLSMVSGI